MQNWSYKLYCILCWLPNIIITLCNTWNYTWWNLCHYRWGSYSKKPYAQKYSLWKDIKFGIHTGLHPWE